jgi:hypothetical protein
MGPGLARVEAERGVKDEGRRGSMFVVRQGRVSSCRAASRPWGDEGWVFTGLGGCVQRRFYEAELGSRGLDWEG